ncbi:MAG: hypothetical protein IT352_08895 [Gemmatimonadales bacterium]|nr:hypothetical protein [Gemmatimonadales bacterium]
MRLWLAIVPLFAGQTPGPPRQPPVILSFSADSAATTGGEVPLAVRLAGGRPTHYRLALRADFRDAAWLPYRERLSWRAIRTGAEPPCPGRTGGSAVRLYLQVKAALGDQIEVVDGKRVLRPTAAESNVQSAPVCVVP